MNTYNNQHNQRTAGTGLTQRALQHASAPFKGTCGDSATAVAHNFVPAFRNDANGAVELARHADGSPACMHLIAYLPRQWAARCDQKGKIVELRDGIVAGFCLGSKFFTREEAAAYSDAHNASQRHPDG